LVFRKFGLFFVFTSLFNLLIRDYSKSDGKQLCTFKSSHRYSKEMNAKHFNYIKGKVPGSTARIQKATRKECPSSISASSSPPTTRTSIWKNYSWISYKGSVSLLAASRKKCL